MKTPKPYRVLFLCTGNSARSIMAEALLNVLGQGRFEAFSAGSHPAGRVQPLAAELATSLGYPAERLRSKSWDEFAKEGAPAMNFVITVCDNAAGETCPVWFGSPVTAHWGVPDPAGVVGDEATRRAAYRKAWLLLRKRIDLFLALPAERLASLDSRRALQEIGRVGSEPVQTPARSD
ncbi:MAG: arsenate reductase ArsC [Xanthomonadales bacterium]|nr:arsenate reductase ArsC [Xanthomonadales bacterium]ODU93117.1 MAG: protein-tyrosine-phosphatase [Rhodanobacter sp. SCN 66-43]OJY84181.1 MAG: protein-tyrosine-phosphatase [Xanthomonadales bacterium 66-474]